MTEKTLWKRIIEFNDEYWPNWRQNIKKVVSPVYLSNALAGEVGEVCNMTKHMIGGGTNKTSFDFGKFADECVDVYIYLVLLMESVGLREQDFPVFFGYKMETNRLRMAERKNLPEMLESLDK